MKTTRQRILDLLESRKTASALELAQAISVTPANIRHHLEALLGEGLIEAVSQRPPDGPGRPTKVYSLKRDTARHNLDRLASALLGEVLDSISPADRTEIYQRIAHRLRGEALQAHSPTQALNNAVRELNQMGYAARWEAHSAGPRLILGHCPYAAILPEHPELCQVDAALLAEMTGAGVQQTALLKPDSRGLPQCIFQVQQTSKT
jgi:predicted ArsR family transcriptional regulator